TSAGRGVGVQCQARQAAARTGPTGKCIGRELRRGAWRSLRGRLERVVRRGRVSCRRDRARLGPGRDDAVLVRSARSLRRLGRRAALAQTLERAPTPTPTTARQGRARLTACAGGRRRAEVEAAIRGA